MNMAMDIWGSLCSADTWLWDLGAATTPHDPAIAGIESVRCRLQMMTNLLNLWDTRDFGELFASLRA